MRKTFRTGVSISTVFLLLAGVAYTQKKAPTDNNGFPSGPHYNLNLIGKKADFACNNAPEPDPITGFYGNVVFVPEDGTGTINMLSGTTKGKTASTFVGLQVPNPCAGFDGSKALVQLQANANGYLVYARALAKPTADPDNPTMTLTPGLSWVEDENADNLVYIGLVTSGGFSSPFQELTRTKGHSVAVPISDMFMWAGTICYEFPPTNLFGDEPPVYPGVSMCYADTNLSGEYDLGDTITAPVSGACPDGFMLTTLYCHTFDTAQWVFNIADLVRYFWGVDTSGSKLVQIRFYPILD